jgi:hypothetical protein
MEGKPMEKSRKKKELIVCGIHGGSFTYYDPDEHDACPLCDAMDQLVAIDRILNPHLDRNKEVI